MKPSEIVVHMDNYNFTNFHQNQMKNRKVLLIAHFSVPNFKVSVELWKSYIVRVSFSSFVKKRRSFCGFFLTWSTMPFFRETNVLFFKSCPLLFSANYSVIICPWNKSSNINAIEIPKKDCKKNICITFSNVLRVNGLNLHFLGKNSHKSYVLLFYA